MINLLPDDYKSSLHYARRNALLSRWLVGLVMILLLATSTVLIGRTYLQAETKRVASANVKAEQSLKDGNLEGTLNTIESISSNLKLIIQVLSRQVVFSELIKQVGAVMPENTVLNNVEISKVQGGIDLIADAADYNAATQVQINLADPNNKLFEKIDIVSIKCEGYNPNYPCRVTLRALFTKDNPFLFINQKKAGQ